MLKRLKQSCAKVALFPRDKVRGKPGVGRGEFLGIISVTPCKPLMLHRNFEETSFDVFVFACKLVLILCTIVNLHEG